MTRFTLIISGVYQSRSKLCVALIYAADMIQHFAGTLTMTVRDVHAGSKHLLRLQPLPSPHLHL